MYSPGASGGDPVLPSYLFLRIRYSPAQAGGDPRRVIQNYNADTYSPAQAGVILGHRSFHIYLIGIPRASGGGSLFARIRQSRTSVFPAQAGVILRGGDPEKPEWLTMDQMYSPRKRGVFPKI